MDDDAVAADDDDDAALPVDVAAAAAARRDGRSRRRRRLVELGVAANLNISCVIGVARWNLLVDVLSIALRCAIRHVLSYSISLLPKACPTPRRKAFKSVRPHRTDRRSLTREFKDQCVGVTNFGIR